MLISDSIFELHLETPANHFAYIGPKSNIQSIKASIEMDSVAVTLCFGSEPEVRGRAHEDNQFFGDALVECCAVRVR